MPDSDLPGERTAVDPLIKSLVAGKYRVERLIGQGGMAKVYLATQEPLDRLVALKVLYPHPMPNVAPGVQEKRFYREAKVASRLTHPNTVVIYDYGRTDDGKGFYIAMEYLVGRTLREAMVREGPFPWQRAVHIALQICGALAEAHAMDLMHRDLKPSNIILVRRGDDPDFVKVLDFGLVKAVGRRGDVGEDLTIDGTFVGSPGYLPPEQILGEPMDQRGDIYSLGVLLFEMLTARTPFALAADAPKNLAVVVAQLRSEPMSLKQAYPAIDAPVALQAAVMQCMRRLPSDRFPTVIALQETLRKVLASGGRSSSQPVAVVDPDTAPTKLDIPAATSVGTPVTTAMSLRGKARAEAGRPGPRARLRALGVALGALALLAVLVLAYLLSRAPDQAPVVPAGLEVPDVVDTVEAFSSEPREPPDVRGPTDVGGPEVMPALPGPPKVPTPKVVRKPPAKAPVRPSRPRVPSIDLKER